MGGGETAGAKKKVAASRGVLMFEDEASFWLDGSLHRTWSRVGVQPRVGTYGERKTAHVYGAIAVDDAEFTFLFAEVFNGDTFLDFLQQLVMRAGRRKVFLILDNGPCHNLTVRGKAWLAENHHRIELHRLPPYSPEFNPMEGVWKTSKKMATHNSFHKTVEARDSALRRTFGRFRREPALIGGHVERYR
jgi:transposase